MQTYLANLKSRVHPHRDRPGTRPLLPVGAALIAIGTLACLLPQLATLGAEILVASILVVWGALGLWFSWEIRPTPEWRYGAAAFGVLFAVGIAFVLFPSVGIATLTLVMMLSFLTEGILSILFGLRSSAQVANWGWLVFSGLCSFAAGVVILFGWPWAEAWALGLVMGVNFLSTGLSLVMLARPARSE